MRVVPVMAVMLASALGHARTDWPFAVGESLHYEAKIGILPAGSADLHVVRTEAVRGKPAIVFSLDADGGPPGLRSSWVLTSWVETDRFASLRFQRHANLAGSVTDERWLIMPDSARYREEGSPQAWVAPAHPMDELAMLYYVRTLPLATGFARQLNGYFRNGFNPVTIRVVGREPVTVGSGRSVPCLRVQVSAAGQSSDIWFTDDARRVPARAVVPLKYGRATLTWDGR